MFQISITLVLIYLAVIIADPRVQLQRGLLSNADIESINQPYPYLFPQSARGRAVQRRGFDLAEDAENDYDEEEMENDGDDQQLKYEDLNTSPSIKVTATKSKTNHLALPPGYSNGILVPDGVLQVEGETVYDEKTGQATLLVPRQALEAIPNGSIVALLDSHFDVDEEPVEERANRVLVRRQKLGGRVKVRGGNRRRGTGKRNNRKNPRGRRPSVQVLSLKNGGRRRGNRRRSGVRPIIVRG